MSLSHRTTRTVVKGREYPLGATVVDGGVNFALYSRNASAVFLLLFDTPDGEPTDVIKLERRDKFVWHAEVRGIGAGQLYGYKVQGDYRPEWGLRFNDAKLMLDGPAAINAPTMITLDTALVTLISGECSAGVTRHTT